MTAACDLYEHAPLDNVSDIRVLLLWPDADAGAPLRCSIEVIELNAEARYSALSYSWATQDGDASASKSIEVHGKTFHITENLQHALLQLRSEVVTATAYRLWIDAICINQRDDHEKSYQVGMMGEIYRLASRVVCWLGKGRSHGEDQAAFTALQCGLAEQSTEPHPDFAATGISTSFKLIHTWIGPRPDIGGYELEDNRYLQALNQCSSCASYPICNSDATRTRPNELIGAFISLVNRRFFERRWIIQEVNIPKSESVTFRLGRYAMAKKDLLSALDARLNDDSQMLRNQVLRCQPGTSLIDLVYLASNTQCSEPRDRIYSLLGRTPSEDTFGIDYKRSIAETYTIFAQQLVEEGKLRTLFANCSGFGDRTKEVGEPIPHLPSWVPDLRQYFSYPDTHYPVDEQLLERCQTTSSNGILSIMLYQIGVLGEPYEHLPCL